MDDEIQKGDEFAGELSNTRYSMAHIWHIYGTYELMYSGAS
jgi:hypothetical protein